MRVEPARPRDRSLEPPPLIHATSSPMVEVTRQAVRIAASDATVLLTGETGTGKEVLARLIHAHSRRQGRALVPMNCAAIPEALIESELFGYVRGAFTGAATSRRGRLAAADGGTLFLDEVGELPLALQAKLLRVLQERSYEPLGSTEALPADFRLVAATNRNLAIEVEEGRFRRDLYYRLLVCPLELPCLRERPDDVPVLFQHFWEQRGETRPVEPAVLARLASHAWPGNVRELENVVERLSVCAEGPIVVVEDLPRDLLAPTRPPVAVGGVGPTPGETPAGPANGVEAALLEPPPDLVRLPADLPTLLREIEDRYIDEALRRSNGSRKIAAELLGLRRTTLVEKIRRRRGTDFAALGAFGDEA